MILTPFLKQHYAESQLFISLTLFFVSCVPLTYPDTVLFLERKFIVHIMWLLIKKHYFYIFTHLDKKLPIFQFKTSLAYEMCLLLFINYLLLPMLEYTAEIIRLNTVMVPFCAYLYFFFFEL